MKIAIIAPFDLIPIWCGATQRLYNLANFLGRDNEVNVYYPDYRVSVRGEIPTESNFKGIPIRSFANQMDSLIPGNCFLKGVYDFKLWLYFPLKKLLQSFLPDIIDVQDLFLFPLAYRLGKEIGAPVVLTEQDVLFQVYGEMGYRTAPLLKMLEIFAIKKADAVVTLTEEDELELSKYVDSQKIFVIPDGVDVNRLNPRSKNFAKVIREKYDIDGPLLVFHGNYFYPPNAQAARIIEKKIIKDVLKRIPETKVMLIGQDPPKVSNPNIITTGFVDDLPQYICAADVAIVPLTWGGGMKHKVLDYLSCGTPVVTTEKGAEGIGLMHRKNAMISADVNDNFIDFICEVINNEALRNHLVMNGRRFVEENYQWKKLIPRYVEVYKKVSEYKVCA